MATTVNQKILLCESSPKSLLFAVQYWISMLEIPLLDCGVWQKI